MGCLFFFFFLGGRTKQACTDERRENGKFLVWFLTGRKNSVNLMGTQRTIAAVSFIIEEMVSKRELGAASG